MGKPTGFMEYDRVNPKAQYPKERIKHFNEFHTPLSKRSRKNRGRVACHAGVPFCQAGMMIGGMASGCPLHNLIPEWNDFTVYGQLGAGLQASEAHQQLPGVHGTGVSGSLREGMYLQPERRSGIHQE